MLLLDSCDKLVLIIVIAYFGPTAGADPENSERGGRKIIWRERDIAPYRFIPTMTGILELIKQYHSN